MEAAALFFAPLLVGLAVGVLSGLLGIGGGTVLVPVFKLGFAMDALAATATSLFTIIPTSISGVVTHVRAKTCLPKIGVAAGIGGALTSPLGVWLAARSPGSLVMVVAALVIAYSAITMLRKALRPSERLDAAERPSSSISRGLEGSRSEVRVASELPQAETTGAPLADFLRRSCESSSNLPSSCVRTAFVIGFAAGVCSGYVGVGGGFLMIPLFMRILNLPMKLASGSSLIAVMILAIPGVVYQGILGNVDWLAGMAVAVGSIPGAALGARLTSRLPERALRFIFSVFLLIAAALLAVSQLGAWG